MGDLIRVWPVLSVLALSAGAASGAASRVATPVLLSFDVEHDGDLEPLAELRRLGVVPGVPATFFFTGEFAENHPDVVAELAAGNTVGSHAYSHADLTTLTPEAVRRELVLAKASIERAAGRPPRWFRAPYGAYDETVMTIAAELGLRYDSSDWSHSLRQPLLLELPVSNGAGGLLASDWSLIGEQKMSHDEVLGWLKSSYRENQRTGRPFVVLLHPFILAPRIAALAELVDFVKRDGGVFWTFDQYLERATAPRPRRRAMWVDWSLESRAGRYDPEQIAAAAARAGITDVFLMARDARGRSYVRPGRRAGRDRFATAAALLRQAGIRVHAWLPALRDSSAAYRHPRWAMLADDGRRSREWLSPSAPQVRRRLLAAVAETLESYDIDGIHLSDLRYPSFDVDFTPRAVAAFARSVGVELGERPGPKMRNRYYTQWTDWRGQQIAETAGEVKALVRRLVGPEIVLSASLIAEAAISDDALSLSGQDYSRLARHLDFFVVPMAHGVADERSADRIARVLLGARHQAGQTPVWLGIDACHASLPASAAGSDGVVVCSVSTLLDHGQAASGVSAGMEDRRHAPAAEVLPSSISPFGEP